MEKFLTSSPSWLNAFNSIEAKKKELAKKVLIRFRERFKYIPSEKFGGYLVETTSKN